MKNLSAVFSSFVHRERALKNKLSKAAAKHRQTPNVLFSDLFFLLSAFLFSRTHLFFGAYPLGIALVCALPFGVFPALFGCLLGSLSLGKIGFVYVLIAVIAVLLRLFVSYGDENAKSKKPSAFLSNAFGESVSLRCSFAIISGFIAGVYEILVAGFSLPTVLYATVMMLAGAVLTFLFCFLFSADFPTVLLSEEKTLPPLSSKNGILFHLGLFAFLFLISYALLPYTAVGISVAYIFSAFATLFFASEFGSIYAICAGFLSAIVGGALPAVSMALAGATAGFLFPFGVLYALVGGGTALVLWSGYQGGITGFLSLLPEYAIATALGFPLWKKRERLPADEKPAPDSTAEDMVGAMALSYQATENHSFQRMIEAVGAISPLVARMTSANADADSQADEIVKEVFSHACDRCENRERCPKEEREQNVHRIGSVFRAGNRPSTEDFAFCNRDDAYKEEMLFCISIRLADIASWQLRQKEKPTYADFCSPFASLLQEAIAEKEKNLLPDEDMSRKLESVMAQNGLAGGVARIWAVASGACFWLPKTGTGKKSLHRFFGNNSKKPSDALCQHPFITAKTTWF